MYDDIDILNNTKEAFVLLAETERRKTFRPVLHDHFIPGGHGNSALFRYDKMPGNHNGIVDLKEGSGHSPRLVLEWAKEFLHTPDRSLGLAKGTEFTTAGGNAGFMVARRLFIHHATI